MSNETQARPHLIRVWDPGVRLFHWLLAIVIALAFLSSEEDSAFAAWHIPIGWVAAVLIAFRLVWGFVGGEHARFASFVRPSKVVPHVSNLLRGRVTPSIGHNPLGALAVLALLALTGATIVTGVLGGEDAHELIAYSLLGLVGVHVAAVLVMSHLARDNLLLAMVTGKKHADRYPDAHDAAPPARLAIPVAALVVGTAAFAATRVDPQAFAPHASSEAEAEESSDGDHGESASHKDRDGD